jgi:hypothetical protein
VMGLFGAFIWGSRWWVWAPWTAVVSFVMFEDDVRRAVIWGRRFQWVSRVLDTTSRRAAAIGRTTLVLCALALFGSAATDTPWMPPERIQLEDRSTMTGYVVGRDGDDLIILIERTRLMRRVDEAEVADRVFCTLASDSDPRRYPTC